ncbi:uncharacterized protein LOC113316148 [Papaver somniferum]|uniref:uncharacterized protein LOC113316148 n=1 Tax=Papaver somniferum TaxID=3469 RepID=UPI000E6FE2F7|nr:uncharacterized protein LOC113316148 [Papaver somniferum]
MDTIADFCLTGNIDPKHNSTFITLVPKKDHIETIKYCRPICLLTSVYKIIAKVLTSRLKFVMDKLISPVQCAYIEERHIIDGTLIANELVDSRLRSKKAGIVCKIDLEKDLDRFLSMEVLLDTLKVQEELDKVVPYLHSCLKVNNSKTRLAAIGDVPELHTWAAELGCATDSLPFIYLAPASVLKILSKKMRNFLWEHDSGSKISHLVLWDLVLAPISRGGLVWIPNKVSTPLGVSCWRAIAGNNVLIATNSSLIIHSGQQISFWNDLWIGNTSLSGAFPLLYKICRNKRATLADMITIESSWKFDFKRCMTDIEALEFTSLLVLIGDSPLVLDALPDTRRWSLNTTGIFSVKSLYSKMIEAKGVDNFPAQFIWKSEIPPKVKFLVWCLVHGKLNTIDNLNHKGMTLYSSCILCGNYEESQEHLFIHCKVTRKLWQSLSPRDWAWVFPNSFLSLANGWDNNHFSNNGKFIMGLIPAAIVWVVFRERNCRIFEEKYIRLIWI